MYISGRQGILPLWFLKSFEAVALLASLKRIIGEDLLHGGFLMNKVSFEQLYMEQLPGLYRLAQSILRQPADAQDAGQQAVLQAWLHLDSIRPGSGPCPFRIFRIAPPFRNPDCGNFETRLTGCRKSCGFPSSWYTWKAAAQRKPPPSWKFPCSPSNRD